LLQIAHPRIPCRKLNQKMGFNFARPFLESRRVGYYLRVLETGHISAGDVIEVIESDPASPTVDEFVRIAKFDYWDLEGLDCLLAAPGLVPGWKETLKEKRGQARQADGWFGLRELEVTRRVAECDDVVSLYLKCPRHKALAPFEGGQYLSLALRPSPDESVHRRAYAISSDPAERSHYRLTIRRRTAENQQQPDGVVSSTLFRDLKIGDRIRTAAPRGFFTLSAAAENCGGLVFISQGIGNAPVVSMLHQWASGRARLPAFVFHGDRAKSHHALRTETVELARRYEDLHLHLLYDEPCPDESLSSSFETAGQLSAEYAVERIACDRPAVFVAGASPFVEQIRGQLAELGIDPAAIHEEGFGR